MAKAIMNGTIYDTETAIRLGMIGSGSSTRAGDFKDWDATLYRAPNGTFFMEGRGGPRSPFAQPYEGNGWQGSEGIVPLDPESALAYAEGDVDVDVILEHFRDLLSDA